MNKQRKQIIEQNEISEMYTFLLGKMPQKVLIEGRHKDLPVVVTLHGGPGSPIPFSVGCWGLFPMFTDHFIMVYWDQLGCGINDYKLKDAFSVDDFVEMTADLIAEVKKLFPDNKIILFGMSWGSILALKALQKAKVSVDAVVVWGQVFRKLFLNEEVYKALEHAGLSAEKMRRIRTISADNFSDTDIVTSTADIQRAIELSDNPNLHCRIIANSGHMPGKEGMDAVFETLRDIC